MKLWLHYRNFIETGYLETRYEDIVENFEGTAKRIFEFTGAPWDTRIMEFYKSASQRSVYTPSYQNVTRPVYKSSVAKWRHYEQQLDAVYDILLPFIMEFGYKP